MPNLVKEGNAGCWQHLKSIQTSHKVFLGLVLAQAVWIIIERSIVLASLLDKDGTDMREAWWFFLLILVSVLFVDVFAFHSVLHANAFELGAFLVASILLLIRQVFEFTTRSSECDADGKNLCIVFLAVGATFNLIHWVMCIKMARDLRWKKFEAVGANNDLRRLYRLYEMYSASKRLDVQFSVIILYTGFIFFTDSSSSLNGLIPNIILFFVEIVWERVGIRAIKREQRLAMYLFWALSPWMPMFIIAVSIEVFIGSGLFASLTETSAQTTIGVMAGLAILNRLITVVLSCFLFHNFGEQYQVLRQIWRGGHEQFIGSRKAKLKKKAKDTHNLRSVGIHSINNPVSGPSFELPTIRPVVGRPKESGDESNEVDDEKPSAGIIRPVIGSSAVVEEWGALSHQQLRS